MVSGYSSFSISSDTGFSSAIKNEASSKPNTQKKKWKKNSNCFCVSFLIFSQSCKNFPGPFRLILYRSVYLRLARNEGWWPLFNTYESCRIATAPAAWRVSNSSSLSLLLISGPWRKKSQSLNFAYRAYALVFLPVFPGFAGLSEANFASSGKKCSASDLPNPWKTGKNIRACVRVRIGSQR